MKKYRIYALYTASTFVGEFEAETEEDAKDMAWSEVDVARLCHQCAGKFDIGDAYELQVEEA